MTNAVLGIVIVLLLLSALLTAACSAAFRIGASRVRTLQEEGFRGAEALAQLRADEIRTRAALRLVTGGLGYAAVGLALMTSEMALGTLATVGVLLVSVLAMLVLTDILPRIFASRHPVRLALLAAPILLTLSRWLHLATTPFVRLEEALASNGNADLTLEERELREIQELGQEEGVLEEHENLLVERAFRLDEYTAWDVMTPRVDVFAWPDCLTLEEIVGQLSSVPYSRVPVYGESVDDITGIVYVREAFQAFVEGKRDTALGQLAREPFFVPGSLSLSRLMQDFQNRRIHMGIVADEFGGIDGLVTLEDVLEELVGEIVDETDVDEEELVRVSRTEAIADAGVDLREINYAFNLSLPTLEHRSLNGFILEELGYVPAVGESLERYGVRIEIVEATDTQVLRARLNRLPNEPTEAAEAP
ncbi:MAG: hemolysin family protein [Gemmatimonadota bacterium]|jgi:CBS domain containing-hemolysin-like protein